MASKYKLVSNSFYIKDTDIPQNKYDITDSETIHEIEGQLLKKNMRYFGFLFIGVIFFLLIISLVLTIIYFEYSPWYYLSNLHNSFDFLENNTTVSTNDVNTWAVRGQIGDILAGHFSALAFLGIAYGIYLQNEANKQMKRQFFISDMNVKLDRYYKTLDKHLETVTEDYYDKYNENMVIIKKASTLTPDKYSEVKVTKLENDANKQALKIRPIVMILDLIYSEILEIKDTYPNIYQTYIKELRVRLFSNAVLYHVVTSFEDFDQKPIYILIKSIKEMKEQK